MAWALGIITSFLGGISAFTPGIPGYLEAGMGAGDASKSSQIVVK
jgi:Flp pilus assembly protein protease CpaA